VAELPTLTFFGAVFSGKGQGKRFVELPWVKQQLIEHTGFTPFAGTLNIRLDEEGTSQRAVLEKTEGAEVKPEAGYYPGYLYKAKLQDTHCFIIIPKVPSYPKDVIEIIAKDNLRLKYCLKDGEKVTVKVTV
jgi:riboflavin kinase